MKALGSDIALPPESTFDPVGAPAQKGQPAAPNAASAQRASRWTTRRIFVAFCAGWLVCLAVSAFVCRSLYADGAWVVLSRLEYPRHYSDYDAHRTFASYIAQTPILLGQRFGLEHASAYAALYTAGTGLVSALSMLFSLWLARNNGALFAISAAAIAVFGFGANFTNSEANLLLAFGWLAIVILALPGTRPLLRGFVLPLLAFVLVRVYEGMLLLGPVLAAWALLESRGRREPREQTGLVLAAILFTLGAFVGFGGFVAPRDPGNAASFQARAFAYVGSPQMFVLLSALCGLATLRWPARRARALWIGAAVAFALAFVWLMLGRLDYYGYAIYYWNRAFLVFLLPLVAAALAVAARMRPGWTGARGSAIAAAAMLVPFLAVAGVDVLGSARWFRYMNAFCAVLDDPASVARGVERLRASGAVTGAIWNHPTLSVLLRKRGSTAVVLNEPGYWEPFDPAIPRPQHFVGVCNDPVYRGELADSRNVR